MNIRFIAHLDTFAVMPRLYKLQPKAWPGVPERGETGDPMVGLGASLLLRGHNDITRENWLDDLPVVEQPAVAEWPSMKRLLERARRTIMQERDAVQLLGGTMARAMLSRLDPGSTIFWHVDDGPYHSRTARFHLPLVTNPGCRLYSGPHVEHVPVGMLTYFNNHVRHCAANWGTTERVHLIFEMYKREADRE